MYSPLQEAIRILQSNIAHYGIDPSHYENILDSILHEDSCPAYISYRDVGLQLEKDYMKKFYLKDASQKQIQQQVEYYKFYRNYPIVADLNLCLVMFRHWGRIKAAYYRRVKIMLKIGEDESSASLNDEKNVQLQKDQNSRSSISNSYILKYIGDDKKQTQKTPRESTIDDLLRQLKPKKRQAKSKKKGKHQKIFCLGIQNLVTSFVEPFQIRDSSFQMNPIDHQSKPKCKGLKKSSSMPTKMCISQQKKRSQPILPKQKKPVNGSFTPKKTFKRSSVPNENSKIKPQARLVLRQRGKRNDNLQKQPEERKSQKKINPFVQGNRNGVTQVSEVKNIIRSVKQKIQEEKYLIMKKQSMSNVRSVDATCDRVQRKRQG